MKKLKHYLARHILPVVNWVSNPIGIKVVPLRTPTRNFREFFSHLENMDFKFQSVIDVGVGEGTPALYDSCSGAQFFLVEPVPSANSTLKAFEKKLGATVHNVAAGSENGSIEFYVHPDVTGSSSYRQLEGSYFDGEKVTVPVRRLDDLLDSELERPCVLKIDTQGAELEVLEGARGILESIDVMIIEVSFHEFREGAPEVHDVVVKMAELGYRVYEILEGHYRSSDSALAQVDMVFVQEGSILRKEKAFFSQAQAKEYLKSGRV